MSLLVIARELWWMKQERSELRWGSTIDQKWSQCKGHLVRNSNVFLQKIVQSLLRKLFLAYSMNSRPAVLHHCEKQTWDLHFDRYAQDADYKEVSARRYETSFNEKRSALMNCLLRKKCETKCRFRMWSKLVQGNCRRETTVVKWTFEHFQLVLSLNNRQAC
jgi:hypothetical protein